MSYCQKDGIDHEGCGNEVMTLAAAKGFEKHGRETRKGEFLARMGRRMP